MFEVEIARGAAFLDEKTPGWRERIDLDKLDLGECDVCVLGQLSGTDDRWAWTTVVRNFGLSTRIVHKFGFSVDDSDDLFYDDSGELDELYNQLTQEWKTYIRETREVK